MTRTNFSEWARTYNALLITKYLDFCMLFDDNEEPEFDEFVKFVWNNTHKFRNPVTQKTYTRINQPL